MFVEEGRMKIMHDLRAQWNAATTNYRLWLLLEEPPTINNALVFSAIDVLQHADVGPMGTLYAGDAAIVDGKVVLATMETGWANDTGSSKTVYGWANVADTDSKLLSAHLFTTPTVVASLAIFYFQVAIRCDDLGL